MNIETIDPSTCSDEDILLYIQQVDGGDALHYKSSWIIMRTIKILVREHLERHGVGSKKPGTLTDKEKKELNELGVSLAPTGRLP